MMMKRVPNILAIADAVYPSWVDGLAGFPLEVHAASDAASIDVRLRAQRFDLVVLDLTLHSVPGLALMRELRAVHKLPVILIGEDGATAARIVALEMGADDCIARPVSVRELVARIRSVLRRTGLDLPANSGSNRVRFDGWELQRRERHLRSPGGLAVPLSNSEYQLLSTFLQAPRRAVSRDDLALGTRGRGLQATSRSVDLLVSRLRHKLMAPDERTPLINAVRGVGYRFDAQSVEVLA